MRFWTKQIKSTGLIEWVCEHGVGHPDYESAERVANKYGHSKDVWLIHGCDGCCTHKDFPSKNRIKFIIGDIFSSQCQVLVNPVNCVGIMGKGLALEFKKRFPYIFNVYFSLCHENKLKIGEPFLVDNVLLFPTKDHWKEKSKLDNIRKGVVYLTKHYKNMEIESIAFPLLGCGLGGLKEKDVLEIMIKYLSAWDIPIEIYKIGDKKK
ncbi:MAG: macro domain-containing protein [Candidatus Njordarchaeia archaeon]